MWWLEPLELSILSSSRYVECLVLSYAEEFWTFTLELHTIFTLYHLVIGKQGCKVGIWIVLLGVDAKVFQVKQLDVLIFG